MDNFNLKDFLVENKMTRNSKLLSEIKIYPSTMGPSAKEVGIDDEFHYKDNHIEWNKFPYFPEDTLYDYENDEEYTKAEFWDTDIKPYDYQFQPDSGYKENGTWTFGFDGHEISGFVDGLDFKFKKGELYEIKISPLTINTGGTITPQEWEALGVGYGIDEYYGDTYFETPYGFYFSVDEKDPKKLSTEIQFDDYDADAGDVESSVESDIQDLTDDLKKRNINIKVIPFSKGLVVYVFK
jgi:hypothetical protein